MGCCCCCCGELRGAFSSSGDCGPARHPVVCSSDSGEKCRWVWSVIMLGVE